MSYMSFVAGGELSGGIKYAVGEMSGRGNMPGRGNVLQGKCPTLGGLTYIALRGCKFIQINRATDIAEDTNHASITQDADANKMFKL